MNNQNSAVQGPHQGQPVRVMGEPLTSAKAAMLMIHGRGASAADILTLTEYLQVPGFTFLAPQAAGSVWYPNRFTEPLQSNEPYLSSALAMVGEVLSRIGEAGIPPERTIVLGFSQGACLALEFAARNPRRYGGVVGLSGGLIGPEAEEEDPTARGYSGSLDGTPVFLGCSDVDFHIPKERVVNSAEVLRRMGGSVTERLYPNMDHTVNQDEMDFVLNLMQRLVDGSILK